MGNVNHEQANLVLRLYEDRREPRLREAREWYLLHFYPQKPEDVPEIAPPGSRENASLRMVTSYWSMAAAMVQRGLIDEEFFFETSGGEPWLVWERLKSIAPATRARMKNPLAYAALEKLAARFEAWREKQAPGSNEVMRQLMAQTIATTAARHS